MPRGVARAGGRGGADNTLCEILWSSRDSLSNLGIIAKIFRVKKLLTSCLCTCLCIVDTQEILTDGLDR